MALLDLQPTEIDRQWVIDVISKYGILIDTRCGVTGKVEDQDVADYLMMRDCKLNPEFPHPPHIIELEKTNPNFIQ